MTINRRARSSDSQPRSTRSNPPLFSIHLPCGLARPRLFFVKTRPPTPTTHSVAGINFVGGIVARTSRSTDQTGTRSSETGARQQHFFDLALCISHFSLYFAGYGSDTDIDMLVTFNSRFKSADDRVDTCRRCYGR